MKKTILLLTFFFSVTCFSQSIIDTIAKESCSCILEKNIDMAKMAAIDIQKELGTCLIQRYSVHKDDFKSEEKLDLSNSDQMRNFGEEVGIKMLNYCPDLIIELGRNSIKEKEKVEVIEPDFLEGEIVDIKIEQFVTIQVKDKNLRIHNLLLLDYFETASLYTNNEIKKKDKIKAYYNEYELFDPKTKEFRYFKIINKLEKL